MLADAEQMNWQHYTGDVLGIIATALLSMGGQKPELPLYSDLTEDSRKPKRPTDTMSKDEIIQYILNKL